MGYAIEVTADHIGRGERKSTDRCPVAMAMRDALGLRSIEVGSDETFIGYNRQGIEPGRYLTPQDVGAFIERYDSGCEVGPFTFLFELEHTPDGPDGPEG